MLPSKDNKTYQQYGAATWMPLRGEDGNFAGCFCEISDSTNHILADRETVLRKQLCMRIGGFVCGRQALTVTGAARSVDDYHNAVIDALKACSADVAFGMLYHVEEISELTDVLPL